MWSGVSSLLLTLPVFFYLTVACYFRVLKEHDFNGVPVFTLQEETPTSWDYSSPRGFVSLPVHLPPF